MKRFRRQPAMLLIGPLGSAAPAYAEDGGCAAALTISAEPKLEGALVSELAAGELRDSPVESCRGVRVELRRSGDALSLTLRAPNGTISRRVSSVVDAAFWVESWLVPDLVGPNPTAGARRASVVAEPAAPPDATPASALPPPSPAPPRATIGLAGRTSLDADGANWIGVELFGDVDIAPPVWLGAGLGRSWDYAWGASELGASIERATTHAVVRVGGAWVVAHRTQWSLGLGVGVMSAFVRGAPVTGGGRVTDDEGVGVIELSSALRFRPAHWLSLRFGLALERSVELEGADPQRPDEPLLRVEPSWRGGLFLGLGLALGED